MLLLVVFAGFFLFGEGVGGFAQTVSFGDPTNLLWELTRSQWRWGTSTEMGSRIWRWQIGIATTFQFFWAQA